MSHLEEGTLHAFLDGEIPSTELGLVRAHLSECPDCRARLTEARGFRDQSLGMLESLDAEPVALAASAAAPFLAAASRQRAPGVGESAEGAQIVAIKPRRVPRWATGVAWAATLVLAVGIGYRLSSSDQILATKEAISTPAELAAGAATAAEPPAAPEQALANEQTPPPQDARRMPATVAARQSTGDERVAADRAAPAAAPPVVAVPAPSKPEAEAKAKKVDLQDAAASPTANLAQVAVPRADSGNGGAPVAARAGRLRSQAATDSLRRELGLRSLKLEEVVVTGTDPRFRASAPVPRQVDADSAIRVLGGSILLIDGLSPDRYEQAGEIISVHYRTTYGPLILQQWRSGNAVKHRLAAPMEAPADSISAWEERIR